MLYAPLGNSSLLSLIDIFWVVYNALAVKTVPQDGDPLLTVQAQRDLFDAVRRRDAVLAQQRLSQHFRNIELRFQRAMDPRQDG